MARFLIPLPLLALLGCPSEKDGTMCTEIAIASVVVNVSTSDGNDADFVVEWSQGGGAATPCEAFGDPGQFVCGYEVAGDIDIDVSASGYEPQRVTATVEAGECHVISETVDVALDPMDIE